MGLEGWEEGMTNRVPIDVGVVGTGDDESSIFSLDSEGNERGSSEEEERRGVQERRRPPASIRG